MTAKKKRATPTPAPNAKKKPAKPAVRPPAESKSPKAPAPATATVLAATQYSALDAADRSRLSRPKAAPASADAIDRLEELAAFRDRGVLTEEEFRVQKARLLQ